MDIAQCSRPDPAALGRVLVALLVIFASVPAQAQVRVIRVEGSSAAGKASASANFLATGSYIGDGSADRHFFDLPFLPDAVIVKGNVGGPATLRTSSMPDGFSGALDGSTGLVNTGILSLETSGFTIDDAYAVNDPGQEYHYVAFEADPSMMAVGSYVGDGTASRSIGSMSGSPSGVLIIAENGSPAHLWTATMSPGESYPLIDGGAVSDAILGATADGFEVGSDTAVNEAGTTYHYLAWMDNGTTFTASFYWGSGGDDASFTGVGFEPEFMIIRHDGTRGAVHRMASVSGDNTLFMASMSAASNLIQDFQPDGFILGDDIRVNQALNTYNLLAFRSQAVASLGVDVALTLAVDDSAPAMGATVNFDLTVTNNGPDLATGVAVQALLPEGLAYVSDAPDVGTYTPGTGEWAPGDLGPGAVVNLRLTAQVESGTEGSTLTLDAVVSESTLGDSDPMNDTAAVDLAVPADPAMAFMATGSYTGDGSPSLSITGVGFAPDLVIVKGVKGDPSYIHTATMPDGYSGNLGDNQPLQARGIMTLDPDGFTVDDDHAVNEAGFPFYWVAMRRGGGQLALHSYVGDGFGYREVTGLGLEPAAVLVVSDDTDLALLRTGDMSAGLSYPLKNTPPVDDGILTFLPGGFSIGGNDGVNKSGVTMHVVAWAGVAGAVTTGTYLGDATDGRLISGVGFEPEYLVVRGGLAQNGLQRMASVGGDSTLFFVNNQAEGDLIESLEPGGFRVGASPDANEMDANFNWLAFANPGPSTDLRVTLGADLAVADPGETVTFDIRVDNSGTVDAAGVEVLAPLPSGLTFAGAIPEAGTYDEVTGTWTVGDFSAGAALQLLLSATVDTGTGGSTLDMGATVVAADPAESDPTDNVALIELIVPSAELILSAVVDDAAPDVGGTLVFTAAVTNTGPDAATGVVVSGLLPAGLAFLTASPSGGSYDDSSGLWDLGDLPSGTTATLTLMARAEAGTGGQTLTVPFSIAASDQEDPDPANDARSVAVTVTLSDLVLAKTVDVPSPDEGALVTFTVAVTNLGPNLATGVRVEDVLPDGLGFDSWSTGSGDYDEGMGWWDVGSVAVGDTARLDLAATVEPGTGGRILTNRAAVLRVDQEDPTPDNDTDTAAVAVNSTDLMVEKTVDDPSPNEGDVVAFTIVLVNGGPTDATGVSVEDRLPAGLRWVSTAASRGAYDAGTGIWTLDTMTAGAADTLRLEAEIEAGTAGTTITNGAWVNAVDQADPVAANDSSYAAVTVASTDLRLTKSVDQASPNEGDTVTYTVTLSNGGPNDATGVQVTDVLPAGLTFQGAGPSQGSYDEGTGIWTIGAVADQAAATLTLSASVDPGTAGDTITNSASVTASDLSDSDPANDVDSADLVVSSTDLLVTKTVDDPAPDVGGTVVFTVEVSNLGPNDATGVSARDLLPGGLTLQAAVAGQGSYDQTDGAWTIGPLAVGDTVRLDLTATVDASAEGANIVNTARVTAVDQTDLDPANDAATAAIDVGEIPDTPEVSLRMLTESGTVAVPGADPTSVLRFELANLGNRPDTLRSLAVTNLTAGPGTPAQADLDAEWGPLSVRGQRRGLAGTGDEMVLEGGSFVAGRAEFTGFGWVMGPGDTLAVTVEGAPSLGARDAAELVAGLADQDDLVLRQALVYGDGWPAVSGHDLVVDGMVADQISVVDVPSGTLAVGTVRNLALVFDLPGNGYLDDVLFGLNLANRGSAVPSSDISRMEAWADDGDGLFDRTLDQNLGDIVYSGDLWQITGLEVPVPAAGRRFFVTVDIADEAAPASEISLELPVEYGDAVVMASGNDGPLDRALVNGGVLAVTVKDRLILSTERVDPGVAFPDAGGVPLLVVNIANTYDDEHDLESLTVTNATVADPAATAGERDAVVGQVVLRRDDGDGILEDFQADPAIGSGTFSAGRVTFNGLDIPVAGGGFERVFVTADLDPAVVADGDVLAAVVTDENDVWAPGSALVGSWPLDSGAAWTVDGMIAAQIVSGVVPGRTLGPGDGPEPALDLVIPSNGYLSDRLQGLAVDNTLGTATGDDLSDVRLWADDGDGAFDALADTPLGAMNMFNGRWVSPVLNRDIPVGGARFFVTVTASAGPTDAATVRFSVPVDGILMQSANSGPVDTPLPPGGTLVLSTSALVGRLDFDTAATSTGQTGTLRMTVRNVGTERVAGIVPEVSLLSGDGAVELGPVVPGNLDLDPDQSADFTWPATATGAGTVVMTGSATGRGDVSGLDHASAPTPTAEHRIHSAVPRLDTYPTANLPASVARGSADLVPLTLTLVNPGDEDVAVARLDDITVRLAETPEGPAIAPAELIERVVLSEGSNVYVTQTDFPTTGDEFVLELAPPAEITGSEPVTLGLRIDLRSDSTVPSFVMIIDDSGSFNATDEVSGFPVPVALGGGTFPIITRQADLVSPAGGLLVTVADDRDRAVEPGQEGVRVAGLTVRNDTTDPTSSPILIQSLGFVPRDGSGAVPEEPAALFAGLSLEGPTRNHFLGAPQVVDSLVVMFLGTPLEVPAGVDIQLDLTGNVAPDADLGTYTFDFAPAALWLAEDAGDGSAVALTVAPATPAAGFTVVAPVTHLAAGGSGLLPPTAGLGTRDLQALGLQLVHPGTAPSAVAGWDSLVLYLRDRNRDPLDPSDVLDRVRVVAGGTTIATLVDPAGADGRLPLSLAAPLLAAGDILEVTVTLDIRSDADLVSFELIADPLGIVTRDTVSGVRPILDTTGIWPVWSGQSTIVVASEELTVGGESLMPALLAPQPVHDAVLRMTLANPAPAGSGDLAVSSLVLGPASADNDFALPGVAVRGLSVAGDGGELGRNDSVAADAADLSVNLTEPLVIPAGGTRDIEILLGIRVDAPAGRLRLALDEGGIAVGPPGSPPGGIRILPAAGQILPLVTEVGNVGPASLSESYINYPNPFAAGREQTTFAYYLSSPAQVTLRLLTPQGESVATLLDGASRGTGLHQDDTWSGENGRGTVVRNGVYIAELVAEFTDGSRERVLRKVAVVR